MPHRVFLLRGNHESKYCTSVYGFEKEVLAKYGDKRDGKHVYRKCLGCFEGLPLASIIAGRVYTAHGGVFRNIPATPQKRAKGQKNRKVVLNPDRLFYLLVQWRNYLRLDDMYLPLHGKVRI